MIVTDHSMDGHNIPTDTLKARVSAWMWSICEGLDWWVTALGRDGTFYYSSSDGKLEDVPDNDKCEYARKVVRYINKTSSHGGVWVAGWLGKQHFVMFWKDSDGRIQINNRCDLHWEVIREWDMEDWSEQCEQAYGIFFEMGKRMQWSTKEKELFAHLSKAH